MGLPRRSGRELTRTRRSAPQPRAPDSPLPSRLAATVPRLPACGTVLGRSSGQPARQIIDAATTSSERTSRAAVLGRADEAGFMRVGPRDPALARKANERTIDRLAATCEFRRRNQIEARLPVAATPPTSVGRADADFLAVWMRVVPADFSAGQGWQARGKTGSRKEPKEVGHGRAHAAQRLQR
jgi:hypothetical protein